MATLTGKCLVRRSDKRIIICGAFYPDFDVSEIDSKDEMWAVEFTIEAVIKFVNTNKLNFSPEDFLENIENVQYKAQWTPK